MVNNGVGTIHNIRKKFHETHELISTSYHEAGHAIYGLLHLVRIESATVFKNNKSKRIEGFTHYNSPDIENIKDPILFNERLNVEICISYSGLIAEKLLFKQISGSAKFPMFLRDGSSDDTLSAAFLLRKYNIMSSGKQRYNYKQKLIRNISKELQDNWDAVTIIAHALFEKKKLCFSDFKKLLTQKTKNKRFWKNQFKNLSSIYDNTNAIDENGLKSILFI